MTDTRETAGEPADPSVAFAELPARQRRREVARVAVRTIVTIAALITIYALVSPNDLAEGNIGTRIVLCLVVFIGVLVAQFFAIMRDPTPELRAGSAMIVAVTLLVLMFSMAYASISASHPDWFTQPIDKSAGIYFTVTVLGTVGFGDIAAVNSTARWVVTTQMILDLTLVVALGRVLVTAARAGRQRQHRKASEAAGGGTPGGNDPTS